MYCTVVVKVQKGVVPIHLWGFMDPLGVCVGGLSVGRNFLRDTRLNPMPLCVYVQQINIKYTERTRSTLVAEVTTAAVTV